MSRPVIDRQSHRRLRAALLAVAAVLGLLAVCLLVFGTTARQSQLGAIVGLWAALIAAFEAPAFRRVPAEAPGAVDLGPLATQLEQHHELQLQATKESIAAQGVDLRRAGELQMARESAARREADVNLQLAIRHEVERTVQDQFGILRQEVSSLRAEVVDKLGGQIKLERIETTRVIGSDLEALQNQIRRLAEDREYRDRDVEVQPSRTVAAAPMSIQPATVVDATAVEATVVEATVVEGRVVEPVRPEPVRAQPVVEPARVEPVRPAAVRVAAPVRPEPVSAPVAAQPVAEESSKAEPVKSSDDGGWSGARSVRSGAAERQPYPLAAERQSYPSGDERRPYPSAERFAPSAFGESARRDPFADLPRLTPVPPEALEPIRTEPSRSETSRTETSRPEAVRNEPKQSEPSSGEPSSDEPSSGEPSSGEPSRGEEPSGRRRAPEDDPNSPHYVGRRRPDRPKAPEPSPDSGPAEGGAGSGRRRAPGHSSD